MHTHEDSQAPVDELFRQLANPLRRQLLLTLARNPDGLATDALAGGPDPERTRVALHHIHLPALTDVGYVEWAPGSSTVARGPRFDAVEPALELLREHEERLPAGRM